MTKRTGLVTVFLLSSLSDLRMVGIRYIFRSMSKMNDGYMVKVRCLSRVNCLGPGRVLRCWCVVCI